MRIWSIHPQYLDAKGLVALWRETLLAQKVLSGNTKGYKNHPQLIRFKTHPSPINAVASYLHDVCNEADKRGYNFNREKIIYAKISLDRIKVTSGQIDYEWHHFLKKAEKRDSDLFIKLQNLKNVEPHPLFKIIQGNVETWEVL